MRAAQTLGMAAPANAGRQFGQRRPLLCQVDPVDFLGDDRLDRRLRLAGRRAGKELLDQPDLLTRSDLSVGGRRRLQQVRAVPPESPAASRPLPVQRG